MKRNHNFIDMTNWFMPEHGQPDSRIIVRQVNDTYWIEKGLSRKQVYWDCECLCGTFFTARGEDIRQGKVKSCGCLQKERSKKMCEKRRDEHSLIGQRFGKLLVIKDSGQRTKSGNVIWECLCDCGNIVYVSTSNLQNGSVRSCGCIHTSWGVHRVRQILNDNHIKYTTEKTYKDCKNETGQALRYDFYINDTFLLEIDGQQHFYATGGWNRPERFEVCQKNDKIKNEYAKSYNIPLKRIPYWDLDKITLENIMDDTYLIKE